MLSNPADYTTLIDPVVAGPAASDPDALALVFIAEDGTRTRVTRGELRAEVMRHAGALAALDLRAGDVIVLVMGHSPALVPAFFGAMALGAAPCIFSYPSERMDVGVYAQRVRSVVENSGARAVLTSSGLAGELRALLGNEGCPIVDADALPRSTAPATASLARPAPDGVAFLQYTSGTTDLPKGIPHTHASVIAYLTAKVSHLRFQPGDVVVSWVPLYHDMGLLSSLLAPLAVGIPTVLMSPFHWVRDPKILLHAVQEFRGTFTPLPNFALNHCARTIRDRDLEGLDLAHWRIVGVGGEPVRQASLEMFSERFGRYGLKATALMPGYGMAENVEVATASPREQPPRVDWVRAQELHAEGRAVPATPRQPGVSAIVSCGHPIAGSEVAIIDSQGQRLPERRVGEVAIRSPYRFHGYHRRPDLTARALRDGWFMSGDLGYMADGELYVCGRTKDLVIVGGRNVYPEDVEMLVEAVPGLRPGRAVAFGVEDAALGSERLVFVCEVVGALDEGQRTAIVRELRRRAAQELDVVLSEVRLVDPGWVIKTSNGKLARSANRDRYAAEYHAPQAP